MLETAPEVSRPAVTDQSGRTWLVTGATNGIGQEVARAVAAAGARLILPARDLQRGHAVADELRRLGADVEVRHLDLANLSSIRRFAADLDGPVDVLVNNAGTVTPRRRETVDGFETILGTNFLGPFALTNLIAGHLRHRVVIVGSGAQREGGSMPRIPTSDTAGGTSPPRTPSPSCATCSGPGRSRAGWLPGAAPWTSSWRIRGGL